MRTFAALVFASVVLTAQEVRPEPATEDGRLPRVLLVGDSISIGYTEMVRTGLAGKANVFRNPANGGPSSNGVYLMESWFGTKKWDVIHFNFGLHDLKQMSDGKQQVSQEAYERYLRLFVERAKRTGARLIFATTTPVPEGKVNPPRTPSDVSAYNAIALRVMQESHVPIDDLYALALAHLSEWQQPVNVHFKPGGYQGLADQVVKSIQGQLKP